MAVYTDVADGALRGFLDEYAIGRLIAFRGIAEGVENSNYALRTTDGDFILTLYERRTDPDDLPWFLGLMRHLAGQGVKCPLPVAGRDGAALRHLCGRPAAITTFLPGVWPRDVTVAHCAALGRTLAALHLAGEAYGPPRGNALGPAAWTPLLARIGGGGEEAFPGMAAELAACLPGIVGAWPEGLPRGQIHADLFPDNVFFLDGAVSGVIDFYFACTDFYAYDLAVCCNAWCFAEGLGLEAARLRALLAGYEAGRALTAAEWAALPVLCQGAAMRFVLTRLYDWVHTPAGALVTRKDPRDYVARLRLHAGMRTMADYGI